MPTNHVVAEGETLLAIVRPYGFGHIQVVLDDGGNQALARRKHPNLLVPGETVVIPDAKPFVLTRPTGDFHKIEVKALATKLAAKASTFDGKPLAPKEVKLALDGGKPTTVSLDGEGAFAQDVPASVRRAELTITFDDPKAPPLVWTLLVGHLGRAEHEGGALARLQNLGYYREVAQKGREFQSAVEEFQCDQGLAVTGELDDDTLAKLVELHGS